MHYSKKPMGMFLPESTDEGEFLQAAYKYQVARAALYRNLFKMDEAAQKLMKAMDKLKARS